MQTAESGKPLHYSQIRLEPGLTLFNKPHYRDVINLYLWIAVVVRGGRPIGRSASNACGAGWGLEGLEGLCEQHLSSSSPASKYRLEALPVGG